MFELSLYWCRVGKGKGEERGWEFFSRGDSMSKGKEICNSMVCLGEEYEVSNLGLLRFSV